MTGEGGRRRREALDTPGNLLIEVGSPTNHARMEPNQPLMEVMEPSCMETHHPCMHGDPASPPWGVLPPPNIQLLWCRTSASMCHPD